MIYNLQDIKGHTRWFFATVVEPSGVDVYDILPEDIVDMKKINLPRRKEDFGKIVRCCYPPRNGKDDSGLLFRWLRVQYISTNGGKIKDCWIKAYDWQKKKSLLGEFRFRPSNENNFPKNQMEFSFMDENINNNNSQSEEPVTLICLEKPLNNSSSESENSEQDDNNEQPGKSKFILKIIH